MATIGKGSNIDSYDRLLGVSAEATPEWNFSCPYCASQRVEISVLDIVTRPHHINVFSDLPIFVRKYYSSLPTITEAVMNNLDKKDIHVFCLDCRVGIQGFNNKTPQKIIQAKVDKSKPKIKKYLQQFYGDDVVMRL